MQPEQFSARRDGRRAEHALWGAVFAQALADLRGGAHLNKEKPRQRTRLMAEAQAWIADRGWTGVGSFPWVCEVLGLDTALVRAALTEPGRPGAEPPARAESGQFARSQPWRGE